MLKLLIVEDEPAVREALVRALETEGYDLEIAEDGAQALATMASSPADALVLDVMLPAVDGLEVARRLRAQGSDVPILMLTARGAVGDRVAGLDAGADDYLVKPFAFAELEARVRALLRRDDDAPPVLLVGDVELDPVRFVASRGGRSLPLTVKEFALLEYFLRHPDEVLSQERLLEHVWDEMADPFTNTVRVTISNLRKKLGDPPIIETVAGRGYVVRLEGGSEPG
jgi:two-component system response regulator MprA